MNDQKIYTCTYIHGSNDFSIFLHECNETRNIGPLFGNNALQFCFVAL